MWRWRLAAAEAAVRLAERPGSASVQHDDVVGCCALGHLVSFLVNGDDGSLVLDDGVELAGGSPSSSSSDNSKVWLVIPSCICSTISTIFSHRLVRRTKLFLKTKKLKKYKRTNNNK